MNLPAAWRSRRTAHRTNSRTERTASRYSSPARKRQHSMPAATRCILSWKTQAAEHSGNSSERSCCWMYRRRGDGWRWNLRSEIRSGCDFCSEGMTQVGKAQATQPSLFGRFFSMEQSVQQDTRRRNEYGDHKNNVYKHRCYR